MTNKTAAVVWAWWLASNIGSLMLFALIVAAEGLPPSEWYLWPGLALLFALHSMLRLRKLFLNDVLRQNWQLTILDLIAAVFLIAALLSVFRQYPNQVDNVVGISVSLLCGVSFLAGIFWSGYCGHASYRTRYIYAAAVVVRTYGAVCLGAMIAGTVVLSIAHARVAEFWHDVVFLDGPTREKVITIPLASGLYALLPAALLCKYIAFRSARDAVVAPEVKLHDITSP